MTTECGRCFNNNTFLSQTKLTSYSSAPTKLNWHSSPVVTDWNTTTSTRNRFLLKHHVNIWPRQQLMLNTETAHTRGITSHRRGVKTLKSAPTYQRLKSKIKKSRRQVCDSTEIGKKRDVSLCRYFHHRPLNVKSDDVNDLLLAAVSCLWRRTWFFFQSRINRRRKSFKLVGISLYVSGQHRSFWTDRCADGFNL